MLLLVKGWNCETPKKENPPSLGRLKPECILNAFAKKVNLVNVINSCFFKPLHFLLDCQKHQRLPLQQFCHKDRKKNCIKIILPSYTVFTSIFVLLALLFWGGPGALYHYTSAGCMTYFLFFAIKGAYHTNQLDQVGGFPSNWNQYWARKLKTIWKVVFGKFAHFPVSRDH